MDQHTDHHDDTDAAKEDASKTEELTTTVTADFDSMGLARHLLCGIYAYGFAKPSALQQRAIVPLTQGRDVIMVSASGTGKTSALLLGLLQRLDMSQEDDPQALIVAPTRELAMAVSKVAEHLGKFMGVRVQAITGGRSPAVPQGSPHVVVGTPGRLRQWLKVQGVRSSVKTWALVELDEMQSRGFEDQLQYMAKLLPANVQVAIEIGSTLPPETSALANKLTRDAITISLHSEELSLERMRQFKVDCEREEWKLETLKDIYATIEITQAVIYCNTRRKVEWLADQLATGGWAPAVVRFHGEMSSEERQRAVDDLVMGAARVMVATDAFSQRERGPAQLSVIINYDLPHGRESYLHRIGRSGRFGRGTAISLVSGTEDAEALRDIETFYSTLINDLPADLSDLP